MKKYLPIIQSKLQHPSYFENLVARRQKIINLIERKNRKCAKINVYIVCSTMMSTVVLLETQYKGLGALMACSCFISIVAMLCEGKYPFITDKEQGVLESLEKELFEKLVSDHTIIQDWAQFVVDDETEAIFIDIVRDITQNKNNSTYEKMVSLLSAYEKVQRKHEKTSSDQKALESVGVKLSVKPAEPYLADKNKLLALL